MSPLAVALAVQEAGFVVLQLSGVRGSEIKNPLLVAQTGAQDPQLFRRFCRARATASAFPSLGPRIGRTP